MSNLTTRAFLTSSGCSLDLATNCILYTFDSIVVKVINEKYTTGYKVVLPFQMNYRNKA